MKKIIVIGVAFLAILIFYSCDPPDPPPGGGGEPTPDITFINFEKDENGVTLFFSNDKRTQGPNGYTYWCRGNEWSDPLDFEVNITKKSGSKEGAYGVIFSAQDINNFWTVFINTNRQYMIGKKVEGEPFRPLGDGWEYSPDLSPGYVGNRIRVTYDVDQEEYFIFFNSTDQEHAISFEDQDEEAFTSGYCGYLAEVHESENFPYIPVDISYDAVSPIGIGTRTIQNTGLQMEE